MAIVDPFKNKGIVDPFKSNIVDPFKTEPEESKDWLDTGVEVTKDLSKSAVGTAESIVSTASGIPAFVAHAASYATGTVAAFAKNEYKAKSTMPDTSNDYDALASWTWLPDSDRLLMKDVEKEIAKHQKTSELIHFKPYTKEGKRIQGYVDRAMDYLVGRPTREMDATLQDIVRRQEEMQSIIPDPIEVASKVFSKETVAKFVGGASKLYAELAAFEQLIGAVKKPGQMFSKDGKPSDFKQKPTAKSVREFNEFLKETEVQARARLLKDADIIDAIRGREGASPDAVAFIQTLSTKERAQLFRDLRKKEASGEIGIAEDRPLTVEESSGEFGAPELGDSSGVKHPLANLKDGTTDIAIPTTPRGQHGLDLSGKGIPVSGGQMDLFAAERTISAQPWETRYSPLDAETVGRYKDKTPEEIAQLHLDDHLDLPFPDEQLDLFSSYNHAPKVDNSVKPRKNIKTKDGRVKAVKGSDTVTESAPKRTLDKLGYNRTGVQVLEAINSGEAIQMAGVVGLRADGNGEINNLGLLGFTDLDVKVKGEKIKMSFSVNPKNLLDPEKGFIARYIEKLESFYDIKRRHKLEDKSIEYIPKKLKWLKGLNKAEVIPVHNERAEARAELRDEETYNRSLEDAREEVKAEAQKSEYAKRLDKLEARAKSSLARKRRGNKTEEQIEQEISEKGPLVEEEEGVRVGHKSLTKNIRAAQARGNLIIKGVDRKKTADPVTGKRKTYRAGFIVQLSEGVDLTVTTADRALARASHNMSMEQEYINLFKQQPKFIDKSQERSRVREIDGIDSPYRTIDEAIKGIEYRIQQLKTFMEDVKDGKAFVIAMEKKAKERGAAPVIYKEDLASLDNHLDNMGFTDTEVSQVDFEAAVAESDAVEAFMNKQGKKKPVAKKKAAPAKKKHETFGEFQARKKDIIIPKKSTHKKPLKVAKPKKKAPAKKRPTTKAIDKITSSMPLQNLSGTWLVEIGDRNYTLEELPGGEWVATEDSTGDQHVDDGASLKSTIAKVKEYLASIKKVAKEERGSINLSPDWLEKKIEAFVAKRKAARKAKQEKRVATQIIDPVTGDILWQMKSKKHIPKWGEFWDPLSSVPNSRELLYKRYQMKGRLAKAQETVDMLYRKLESYPLDERRFAFMWLDKKRFPLEHLSKPMQKDVKRMRMLLNAIGKKLVDSGQIRREIYEKNKDSYVHYMYVRHIIGGAGEIVFDPGTGKLNGGYTIARNPNLTERQKREIGWIEDVAISVPVGVAKTLQDLAKLPYMEAIANNPEWSWSPSIIDVPGIGKMGIGKLVREVELQGSIAAREKTPEAEDRFKRLDDALTKAREEKGEVPEGYTLVPNSKEYGPLAGSFIRTPIADDLMPLYNSGHSGEGGMAWRVFKKFEANSMQIFKMGKVALNPPTAARNVVSNGFQNNLRGRPLQKIPGDWYIAIKAMYNKDIIAIEAKHDGIFSTNFSVTELAEILDDFKNVNPNKWDTFMAFLQKQSRHYGRIDDVAKFAIYHQMRRDGHSRMDATLEAQFWGMDYSLTSRSIKEARRHAVPFVSYQYKVAPLLVESYRRNKLVLAKYFAFTKIIAPIIAAVALGMNAEDRKELKKMEAKHIRNAGSPMLMPWKDEDGRYKYAILDNYFPWGNWYALGKDTGIPKTVKDSFLDPIVARKRPKLKFTGPDVGELYRDSGITNPSLSVIISSVMAVGGRAPRDPYSGIAIYNELDPPQVKVAKYIEFIYNVWAPSFLSRRGVAGRAFNVNKEDRWGIKDTPGEVIGRAFGLNLYDVEKKKINVGKKAAIKHKREEYFRAVSNLKPEDKDKKNWYTRKFRDEVRKILNAED